MRLRTITNIAYAATVLLTLAGGTTMLLASSALEAERAAVSRAEGLKEQTAAVGQDVLRLSDRAREYVITGKEEFLEDYLYLRQALQQDEAPLIKLWERCELVVAWNDPSKDISRKVQLDPEGLLLGWHDNSLIASVMAGYEGHRGGDQLPRR